VLIDEVQSDGSVSQLKLTSLRVFKQSSVAEGLLLCCVGGIYSGGSPNTGERLAHRTVTTSLVQLLGESTIMKFSPASRVEPVTSCYYKGPSTLLVLVLV
jgi:hypothetical protein